MEIRLENKKRSELRGGRKEKVMERLMDTLFDSSHRCATYLSTGTGSCPCASARI
jgi:hypothetical protein